MLLRILGASIVLTLLGLSVYPVLLNPAAQASPQEVTVVTRTKGHEELKATILGGQLKISLKNNHTETITAFAISFGDTTIEEDFAYSEVRLGIEPGRIFEKSYPSSGLSFGAELPTLYLLAVVLNDGTNDGNFEVAQQISDERLGEKIQIYRTIKVLEKEGLSRKDIKTIKGDITAALDAGDDEARIIRKELVPSSGKDDNLSEDVKKGLHWGREKMLRRFQTLEQMPAERQEQGVIELKDRSNKLFAKL